MPMYWLIIFSFFVNLAYGSPTPVSSIISSARNQLQPQLKNKGMSLNSPVFIRVFKTTTRNAEPNRSGVLELWKKTNTRYHLFKTYPICYYSGHLGPKLRQGDLQAPEGLYKLTPHQLQPFSSYRLGVNIGYPNNLDLKQHSTGDNIMIHGGCESKGCLAMTDKRIDEIYTLIFHAFKAGQKSIPLHIFPFKLTKQLDKDSPHYSFWKTLIKPYQSFEKTHRIS